MTEPFAFMPLDPAFRREPWALYARGRREHPAHEHVGLPMRIVSIFRHEDVQATLRDDAAFSNSFPTPRQMREELGEDALPPPSMLGTDGAEHTRLRGLVNKAFTPRIVSRLEPRLREVARELVDEALAQTEVDLVQALTYPLPVTAIAEMIGIPVEERARFKRWSDQLVANLGVGFFGGLDAERIRLQRQLRDEMHAYLIPLAEERRRQPREDLLTGLVQAEHEGSKLSHDEMLQMLILLLVAGNETTTTLIGNAVLALLAHPEQERRVRERPLARAGGGRGDAALGLAGAVRPAPGHARGDAARRRARARRHRAVLDRLGEPRRARVRARRRLRSRTRAGAAHRLRLRPALLPRREPRAARGLARARHAARAHQGDGGGLRERGRAPDPSESGVSRRHEPARSASCVVAEPASAHSGPSPSGMDLAVTGA